MLAARIIPILLLRNTGLVKTVHFKNPVYVGDPLNAVRIFNDKEIDELVFLDIGATGEGREPPFDTVAAVASECFMPFCYGGGVRSVATVERLFRMGAEKVAFNSCTESDLGVVEGAAKRFGSQSIIGSMDVKRDLLGRTGVYFRSGTVRAPRGPVEQARRLEEAGVGEILLTSIDRDGTMRGYDLDLVRDVAKSVSVPVIAAGGASSVDDMVRVIKEAGAAAAGAGSLFVFHGKRRAVLITYPDRSLLEQKLGDRP